MTGIVIQLLLTFFILKYVLHQDLEALGLKPTKRRLTQLILGFSWPILYYFLFEFSVAGLVHNPYHINAHYTFTNFIRSVQYLLRSVVYEELIFRGVLFYILINKIGAQKAILTSAAAFGVYHWFAWQAFGNPAQMLIIFLTTGSAGYLFAMAFVKTRSMYLAAGLHFGCNCATIIMFSKDKTIGLQWLVKSFSRDPVVPGVIISLIVLLIHFVGFQIVTYLWLRRWHHRC